MEANISRFVRFGAGLLGLAALGWVLTGQAAKPVLEGLPTDWTHQHLIFSQPASSELAGRLAVDPRYWQQWYRQNVARILSTDTEVSAQLTSNFRRMIGNRSRGLWSENLGNNATVGAGNFPAKYSFGIATANCGSAASPDFVVFSTGLSGGVTQASIVAFDNLYSGCTGTVPSIYWAYNTGGQILTSPVFSRDGSQIAFVQTSAGAASLVLLKWQASTIETVSLPGIPLSVVPALYSACATPCMTTIALTSGGGSPTATNDTTSSVFYDYVGDAAWVGDASGWLHQFNPVFSGTPAEIRTSPWPVQVNSTTPRALASPVHDHVSGNVFVGDQGGIFYRVIAATGAVTASGQVDFGVGLVSGPIVDASAGKAYVFASSDGSTACGALAPCSAVYQFAANFGGGTTGTKVTVGTSSATPNPLYEGTFDSAYLSSFTGTGNLYVCGNTGGAPTLYQVPVTAGVVGAAVAGPPLASASTGCSPVSDVPNPNATPHPNEWIFASAQASGSGDLCAAGGCAMNFVDKPWTPSTAYVVGQEVLDTHFQIQVVRLAGTSRTAVLGHPAWSVVVGASTADATVRWLNQGPQTAAHAAWLPTHAYALHAEILDTNGNIQTVITAGTSKANPHPVWNVNVNGATADGAVLRWRNVGPVATNSLAAAGGTSGVIMDNVVGTLAGASQVYFSTQSNQICGTSGTGGCATQASQSALK